MPKKPDKKFLMDELEDGVDPLEEPEEGLLVQHSVRGAVEEVLNDAEQGPISSEGAYLLDEEADDALDWSARPQIESMVENRPSTKLQLAIRKNDKRKIRKLIKGGVNVNEAGHDGMTPLMAAISTRQIALVKLLVGVGADLNALSDDGFSALTYAIRGNMENMVRYLLANGAKVDLLNYSEETSLMEALYCENPSERIISMLIDAGASVLHKSITGDSPIALVERSGNHRLIRFFSEKTHFKLWSDKNFEEFIRKDLRRRMKTQFPN